MSYKIKYLKYKNKYVNLKKELYGGKTYNNVEWEGSIKTNSDYGKYNFEGTVIKNNITKKINTDIVCEDIVNNDDKIKAFCKINNNNESEYEWKKNNSADSLSWTKNDGKYNFKSDLFFVNITRENKKILEKEITNKMNIQGENKDIFKVTQEDVINYFLNLNKINKIINDNKLSIMVTDYLYEKIIKRDDNTYYINDKYKNIIIKLFLDKSDKIYYKYLTEYMKHMNKIDVTIFLKTFNSSTFIKCIGVFLNELEFQGIKYLGDIKDEQVYIDDYNDNLIKIITSIINVNDLYDIKNEKKWNVSLKVKLISFVIIAYPIIIQKEYKISNNIQNLFPINKNNEMIMFPEEIVNHFYKEFIDKKNNNISETTKEEIIKYFNKFKKNEITQYLNNFNNEFIYNKINLKENVSENYKLYLFFVREILKGMTRYDILIFINKFKQPGGCDINMCFKKLIDYLQNKNILVSQNNNYPVRYNNEQYIKLNFLYDMCDNNFSNINDKIKNKNFATLEVKEIKTELSEYAKNKNSNNPIPKNCPSKNIYPEEIESDYHYKAQSLLLHPSKNTNCINKSNEKFQELNNLNELFKKREDVKKFWNNPFT